MASKIRPFTHDITAAVSPLYAIALFALVAIAGVGFDYGRLATLQTELQNAADQAALAAATQLDGADDAIVRARSAATARFASAASQYTNETRVADDGEGESITDLTFRFYQGYENDQPIGPIASDADGALANVVHVTVNGREVFYALTPVVGVFSSGDITADAMAKLDRAACNLPPIMVCIEREDYFLPTLEGYGLRMRWLPSSGIEPLAPGNFGFLEVGISGGGNPNRMLGSNSLEASCFPRTNVMTRPGFRSSETDALNTRFDIYKNPLSCDAGSGDFCPTQNVRKNFILEEEKTITTDSDIPPDPPACGDFDRRSSSWSPDSGVQSFTPDSCFANGTCTYMGDGVWDIDSYLAANHPGVSAASFEKGSRYEVYQWELEDPANRLAPRIISSEVETDERGNSGQFDHTFVNRCSYPQPVFGTPLIPSTDQKDRRILPIAAVDCSGLRGRDPVDILGWIDVFLVQPGDDTETIQAEVIGPALRPGELPSFQYFAHDRAVLIR